MGEPSREPLRALSLACAGGEEPYSIAIALRDAGLPARRFRIDAVNVSARRLAVARQGIYSANAFRGCELGGRAPFFREHAQGFEVNPAIRATVRFLQASALGPEAARGLPPYDVLFCRNLLIYLDAPARRSVLAAIDRLLAADGVLFIGHADRLEMIGEPSRFAAVGEPGCFAYRKAAAPATGEAARAPNRRSPGINPISPRSQRALGAGLLTPPWGRPKVSRVEAIPLGRSLALPGPSQPPAFLEQASELANRGRHAEAIAACEQHIRLKGPGASVYYLMGMICQAAGDRRRAEECFHKTVYLDPNHDEALLALSLLAERRGDRGTAAGFRRRARRTSVTTKPERSE